jgi:ABC transport system ATP-binding/permease protein
MLSTRDISFAHPGSLPLLNGVSFSLDAADRIALVGENGAGKSTLFHILMGLLTPDDGQVHIQNKRSVGLLKQIPDLNPDKTVLEIAQQALGPLLDLIETHEALCAALENEDNPSPVQLDQLHDLTQNIEKAGGFAWKHRVDEVLARFSIRNQDQKVQSLSGGERRRLDLAQLILRQPDILLLDEPTNHLDAGAIRFLADTLKDKASTVLLITHDRMFLDDVATRIIELEKGDLYTHEPPYKNFLENRLVRQEIDGRSAHRRERLWARELAWLRAGVKARTTKQKARIGRAETLVAEVEHDVLRRRDGLLQVQKSKSNRLGRTILEFKNASLKRGDKLLIDQWTFLLARGERWGIVGPNGCGKTSLLRAITGDLSLSSGEIVLGKKSQIGLLDQHRDVMQQDQTLGEVLAEDGDHVFVGDESVHIASYLERFLFAGKDRYRPTKTLSGGEQNRLHLARLFLQNANCLLLDEPTNDLDITTLGVLEDLLLDHQGVALIVSHDRQFLDRVCTGILAFEPPSAGDAATSSLCALQGDYTHYLRMRSDIISGQSNAISQAPAEKRILNPSQESSPSSPDPDFSSHENRPRKRTYREGKEYRSIEADIQKVEARSDEVRTTLNDSDIYRRDPEQATALAAELAALETEVERLYERWQELEGLRS